MLRRSAAGADATKMKASIMVDREDLRTVEAEEQFNFVRTVLESMGLPTEECFPEESELTSQDITLQHKINLRQLLKKFQVMILDDRDGGIKIFVDEELVAEWKKSRFELRQDLTAIDPKKKLYAVLHIDYWTMFEEQTQQ